MEDKLFVIYQELRAQLQWLASQYDGGQAEVARLLSEDFPLED